MNSSSSSSNNQNIGLVAIQMSRALVCSVARLAHNIQRLWFRAYVCRPCIQVAAVPSVDALCIGQQRDKSHFLIARFSTCTVHTDCQSRGRVFKIRHLYIGHKDTGRFMLHPNKVSYKMSTVSSRREDQTEWDDWPSALKCQGYGKQEVANTSHPCLTLRCRCSLY